MKLAILAIGKPGRGPEAALASDYAARATAAGRALGLGPLDLIDLDPRKTGKAPEAELILAAAEGAEVLRTGRHHHLAGVTHRDLLLFAEFTQHHIAQARETCLERIRRVVEARVKHTAVATRSMLGHCIFFFEHDYPRVWVALQEQK